MYSWQVLEFEVTAIMVFVFMFFILSGFTIYHQFRVRRRVRGLEELFMDMDDKLDLLLEYRNSSDVAVTECLDHIMEIKDRMAFLEATSIMSMASDSSANARSQGAKEMWKRRRMGKIERKDG
jgi:hypothetical protein